MVESINIYETKKSTCYMHKQTVYVHLCIQISWNYTDAYFMKLYFLPHMVRKPMLSHVCSTYFSSLYVLCTFLAMYVLQGKKYALESNIFWKDHYSHKYGVYVPCMSHEHSTLFMTHTHYVRQMYTGEVCGQPFSFCGYTTKLTVNRSITRP